MTTEVSKANSGLPANVANMAAALAQSQAAAGANNTGELYMRFTKFGEWLFGAENVEAQDGSVWAVNPQGFQHGWIAWNQDNTSGGPRGERMVPATQPMPAEMDLPEVDGEWSKCVAVQLRCTNGEDEGVQTIWKANSHGGRKAYASLLAEVIAQLGENPEAPVALVELKSDSYTHKTYGKIFSPELEVVGWASMDGEAAEKPAAIEVDATPSEEPAPQEEAPRRRRRKKAS